MSQRAKGGRRRVRRLLAWVTPGYLFGLAFLAVTVSWLKAVHPAAAVAVIGFEAGWFATIGVGIRSVGRLRWWPIWAALCWAMVEFAYSRFPFGGFGWVRLGFSMVDAPLAGYLPFIGLAGVSFLTALAGQVVAYLVEPGPARRRIVTGAIALAVFLAGFAGFAYQPAADGPGVTVGFVQGNVDGVGIEALGRERSVTNNHLSETIALLAKAQTGQVPNPDFIVWPENSTDIDPTRDAITGQVVDAAAALAGRPILVGAVMRGPGRDQRQTAGLWWHPGGYVEARYNKRNLVPFGEFIPFRDQLLPLIPLLARVGAQSVPGTTPGALRVRLADGRPLVVGDVICFELAYDQTVYASITGGAQVLTVQSNNATYRGSAQVAQQFAITRVRAMETRREIIVATTNSLSGFVGPDGSVRMRTREGTSTSGSFTMPLRSFVTPAVRLAGGLDVGLALVGLLGALAGLSRLISERRRRRG